jgi:MFS family permease
MAWMVAGRVLQGLGGGMLGVALYVGMGQLVPPALHPRMFGLFATAWVLPGLLGPSLAAWLVTHLGWRSVFLVVAAAVPVTAALLLPSLSRTPRPGAAATQGGSAKRLVGWAALGGGGALLLHGAGTAGTAGLGLLMLALGAASALTAALRLLPAGTLRVAPGLPAVIALRGLLAASFATAEVFLPLLLTREQGWTLAEAGLALSTGALLWSAGSSVQSRLKAPADRRRGLQAGLSLLTLGIALVALQAVLHAAGGWMVVAWVITGFGIGLSFPMLSVLTLSLAPPDQQGQASSALQLSDALGTSAALALAGALFTRAGGLAGCLAVLGVAGALALSAALLGHRAFATAHGSITAS